MTQVGETADAAGAPGRCDGCTLCCSILNIAALDKPPYRKCRHIVDGGCAIYTDPGKPAVCGSFICRYILAHRAGYDERHTLPHPNTARAFVFSPPDSAMMVLCIDPHAPQAWRGTGMVGYLRDALDSGYVIAMNDRGYSFVIDSKEHLQAVAAEDQVEIARAMGIEPNSAGFTGID